MRLFSRAFVPTVVLTTAVLSVGAPPETTTAPPDPDKQLLLEAGVPVHGEGLLQFFRERSRGDTKPDPKHVARLIRQLGSDAFSEREQAADELTGLGPAVLTQLVLAQRHTDPEVAGRAKTCVQKIESAWHPGLLAAGVRYLLRQPPDGTAQALLQLLPFATTEEAQEEIWFGLDALAVRQRSLDPVFARALKDPEPVRRALAVYLLGRRGNAEQRGQAKQLLADLDPVVRLRAAQGLLGAKDKDAVPVLIALLDQPSIEVAWQAEELLHYVAGDLSPEAIVGTGSAPARESARKAWEGWWRQHGPAIDLPKLDQEPRRPGLVLMADVTGSHAWLTGCDGKPRWQFKESCSYIDVQLLRGARLLMAQCPARPPGGLAAPGEPVAIGVTERDVEGKILWQYRGVSHPVACRRLPNGNTQIVDFHQGVEEVTPQGERIFFRKRVPPGENPPHLAAPFLLGNGRLAYRLDRGRLSGLAEADFVTGRIIKELTTAVRFSRSVEMQSLPGGHHLLMSGLDRLVLEVDAAGKTVWQYQSSVNHAVRLRSGNILISSNQPDRVVEIDRSGKMVGEIAVTSSPRLRTCLELVRLGFDAPYPADLDLATSVSYRIRGLSSSDARVRELSAIALGRFGPKAAEAIPALTQALSDPDQLVRRRAQDAVKAIRLEGSTIQPKRGP